MTTVILVHGIGQERADVDQLTRTWVQALRLGIWRAGWPEIADRLGESEFGCRMAYYGDLFHQPGRMGVGQGAIEPARLPMAEELAQEWIRRAVEHGDPREQHAARLELDWLSGTPAGGQGARNAARSAIASLARLRTFATQGMALAQALVDPALDQVTRYFHDDALRAVAISRVTELVTPDTRIVVGHSLGSVIAYEALHLLTTPIDLFLTLGSPLGLRTIIHDKVRPRPAIPPTVQWWVNIADKDDIVAADPYLERSFRGSGPGAIFEATYLIKNEASPHSAVGYLKHQVTGRPIAQVLHRSRQIGR